MSKKIIMAEIELSEYETLLDWVMYGGNYTMKKNDPHQNECNKKLVMIVGEILSQSAKM